MATPIIEIKGLRKEYKQHVAVENLELDIYPGEIFGLLGPNGAGKSTTILMMLGLTEATSGSIRIDGIDPQRDPVAVKKMIGYLPDNIGFYEHRTGIENLTLIAELNGFPRKEAKERAYKLLERVGLTDVAEKKVGTYSRGMKQRLGLADTLIKDPKIVILDEPTLGLDPTGVKEFLQLIQDLSQKDNLTVLLSSHHLHQVQEVCSRVGLFVRGKLIAQGNVQELARQLFSQQSSQTEVSVALYEMERLQDLQKALENIDGVSEVTRNGNQFVVSHSFPSTSPIVRQLVDQQIPILRLQQKSYGLDDIYAYYFEGKVNEKLPIS